MKDPGPGRIRVASAQYALRPITDYEQFAAQVAAVAATAAGYKCRLLVLPEYFTIQLASLGETDRPIAALVRSVSEYTEQFIGTMQALARRYGLYVVAGTIPTPEADGRIFNDSYLFAPSGKYGVQGKLHMTRFEREDWGVSARDEPRVFDTELGRIAIAVCYDVEFPELIRELARHGVHMLCVPSSTDDRQGFFRVRYCAHARTIENHLYVVHSPTVGSLPSIPDVSLNYGTAAILTPCDFAFSRDGVAAEGVLNQEDLVVAELDLHMIEQSRSFGTVLPLEDSKRTRELTKHIEVVSL